MEGNYPDLKCKLFHSKFMKICTIVFFLQIQKEKDNSLRTGLISAIVFSIFMIALKTIV